MNQLCGKPVLTSWHWQASQEIPNEIYGSFLKSASYGINLLLQGDCVLAMRTSEPDATAPLLYFLVLQSPIYPKEKDCGMFKRVLKNCISHISICKCTPDEEYFTFVLSNFVSSGSVFLFLP